MWINRHAEIHSVIKQTMVSEVYPITADLQPMFGWRETLVCLMEMIFAGR